MVPAATVLNNRAVVDFDQLLPDYPRYRIRSLKEDVADLVNIEEGALSLTGNLWWPDAI
jgi:hypothetical protein